MKLKGGVKVTNQEVEQIPSTPSNKKARESLRRWLTKYTNCNIQDNWPCGTCTIGLLTSIGLDSNSPIYKAKNPIHDRHNEVWRAIIQIREAELVESSES